MTELRERYQDAVSLWLRLKDEHPTLNAPLLTNPRDEYFNAPTRLMIVGQQTGGWGEETNLDQTVESISEYLLQGYRDFDLGARYRHTPFWRAAFQIARALNPTHSRPEFIWTNLVKIADAGQRPRIQVEDEFARVELLQAEIRAFEPDVVVFFTGPEYDARLLTTLAGCRIETVSSTVASVKHSALPPRAFRSNHPNSYQLRRQWSRVDELVERCSRQGD